MTVKKSSKTGYYEYNFMLNGVRYHRSFKNATYKEVCTYESVARAELIKSGYDIVKENKQYTLSQIIEDYYTYIENCNTQPKYTKVVIERFYKIVGNKLVNKITLADIEKYRAIRKDDIQNSTINREINSIRRMFNIAIANNKLKENPCKNLTKLRIVNPTKRYLTSEEEKKLLAATHPIMQSIIIFAIHTGMRCSEIKNLKWSDVFIDNGYLLALNTKNGKSRKLVITPQMKDILNNMPVLSEYVFTNPLTRKPYTDFKTSFKRAVIKSGIPHITFHELRHTTASRLNELGVDLKTIQEYLDHSDIKTTQGYIHKPRKNITDAINRLANYNECE